MLTACVIGAGYVGSNLIADLAEVGVHVIAADTNRKVVTAISEGLPPITGLGLEKTYRSHVRNGTIKATANVSEAVEKASIVSISVPTPINANVKIDLRNLKDASIAAGRGLHEGCLIVIESTVPIGTTRKIVIPLLEQHSGLKAGKSFGVAYAPERIDPGNRRMTAQRIPRIVSGLDRQSTRAAIEYLRLISLKVIPVDSFEIAEAAKLVENTYRDVNIAFANEVALFLSKRGVDAFAVLRACATKWNFQLHLPGTGVGGYCIPFATRYLLANARQAELRLSRLARKVNDTMPLRVADLIEEALNRTGKTTKGSKVALMGLSYKANLGEMRGSPAITVYKTLRKKGARVSVHDPHVFNEDVRRFLGVSKSELHETLKGADCVVILTEHNAFKKIKLSAYATLAKKPTVLVDGRGVYNPREAERIGMVYMGIGRPNRLL
jgi:nucleotide sugar dehydrogenase